MDKRKDCPECDAIAAETRSAFIKIISNRILDEELARFLACLFASEENLARLTELWERSEFADVRQRWLQHKRTLDTVDCFNTMSMYQCFFVEVPEVRTCCFRSRCTSYFADLSQDV